MNWKWLYNLSRIHEQEQLVLWDRFWCLFFFCIIVDFLVRVRWGFLSMFCKFPWIWSTEFWHVNVKYYVTLFCPIAKWPWCLLPISGPTEVSERKYTSDKKYTQFVSLYAFFLVMALEQTQHDSTTSIHKHPLSTRVCWCYRITDDILRKVCHNLSWKWYHHLISTRIYKLSFITELTSPAKTFFGGKKWAHFL